MFELKQETNGNVFHVKLLRELTSNEVLEIAQIAANITRKIESSSGQEKFANALEEGLAAHSFIGQTYLGERQVSAIKMGEYVEPSEGVKIKMLSFPSDHKIEAVKLFRAQTGLPIMASKDILYGNHPCPILKTETAKIIMDKFREWNIYAKVEPASLTTGDT